MGIDGIAITKQKKERKSMEDDSGPCKDEEIRLGEFTVEGVDRMRKALEVRCARSEAKGEVVVYELYAYRQDLEEYLAKAQKELAELAAAVKLFHMRQDMDVMASRTCVPTDMSFKDEVFIGFGNRKTFWKLYPDLPGIREGEKVFPETLENSDPEGLCGRYKGIRYVFADRIEYQSQIRRIGLRGALKESDYDRLYAFYRDMKKLGEKKETCLA
jgi:hypothetical protein